MYLEVDKTEPLHTAYQSSWQPDISWHFEAAFINIRLMAVYKSGSIGWLIIIVTVVLIVRLHR